MTFYQFNSNVPWYSFFLLYSESDTIQVRIRWGKRRHQSSKGWSIYQSFLGKKFGAIHHCKAILKMKLMSKKKIMTNLDPLKSAIIDKNVVPDNPILAGNCWWLTYKELEEANESIKLGIIVCNISYEATLLNFKVYIRAEHWIRFPFLVSVTNFELFWGWSRYHPDTSSVANFWFLVNLFQINSIVSIDCSVILTNYWQRKIGEARSLLTFTCNHWNGTPNWIERKPCKVHWTRNCDFEPQFNEDMTISLKSNIIWRIIEFRQNIWDLEYYHGVWKSQKKSNSSVRAFIFGVDKS